MANNKTYDWFAASLYQPQLTPDDLVSLGVTAENSSMLDRETYKNNDDVKAQFTTGGQFDEAAFNNFYDACLTSYNTKAQDDFEQKVIDDMAYDPYNWLAPVTGKVEDIRAKAELGKTNKLHKEDSIEVFGRSSAPLLSDREIGQMNFVRDKDGNVLDFTPNDRGFFKSIFDPTYVLAQYDEDTVDEFGIQHYKGELKRDEDGATYYEELGDRTVGDRIVLRPLDVLTEDTSAVNKYDFFDQDSLETEGWKAVAHNAAKIAPMLIPGIGEAYATGTALLNMAKVMPELGKAINGIIGLGEDQDNEFLTKMEGVAAKFGASKSDKSMQETFTMENFADFVGSTAVQLFQQQGIANNSKKLLEAIGSKNMELAGVLSSGYMAATSCEGVYEAFKEAGSSDLVAGIATMANIAALYSALNMDYFKRFWAKGNKWLDPMMKDYKRVAYNVATDFSAASAIEAGQQQMPKEAAKGLLKKLTGLFSEKLTPTFAQGLEYTAGEYFSGAINEGVEEVMEESFVDISKGLAKAFEAFGIRMTSNPDDELNFGFTAEEAGKRYLQAFVGGFGGGAIFHGINRMQQHEFFKVDFKKMDENSLRELSYIIAQGRGDEIRAYYKKLHDKGLLGSTTLSGTKFDSVIDAEGNTEEKAQTTTQSGDSQNDLVYDALLRHIDYIENMMTDEGIKISERELNNDIMNWIADTEAHDFFGNTDFVKEKYHDKIRQASFLSKMAADGGMLNQFNYIGAKILRAKNDYDNAVNKVTKEFAGDTTEIKEKRKKAINESKEVQRAKERLEAAREELKAFRDKKNIANFVGRGTWLLQPSVASKFAKITDINTYASVLKGTSFDKLTDEEKADMQFEYKQYMEKEGGKANLWRAYDVYKGLSTKYKPLLDAFDKSAKDGKLDDRRTMKSLYRKGRELAIERRKLDDVLSSKEASDEEKKAANDRIVEIDSRMATLAEQCASLVGIQEGTLDPSKAQEIEEVNAKLTSINALLSQDPENQELINTKATLENELKSYTLAPIAPDLMTFGNFEIDGETAYSKINNAQDKQAAINEMAKYIKQLYIKAINEGIVMQDDQEFEDFLRNLKPSGTVDGLFEFPFSESDFVQNLTAPLTELVNRYNNAMSAKDYTEAQKAYNEIDKLLDGFEVDNGQGYIAVSEEDDKLLMSMMDPSDSDTRPFTGIYLTYEMTGEQEEALGDRGSTTMTPYVKEAIIKAVLPSINGKPSVEFVNEMQKLKSKITYTPTKDILSGFYREINGVNSSIIDTIDAEMKGFVSYKSLSQYLLKSKGSEAQLKSIEEVVDILTGLLEGAASGLNESINTVAGDQSLLVLDSNTTEMVKKDLAAWKTRVDDLLTLANENSANKLNEQRDIAAHCLPLYGKRLLSDEFNKTWTEKTGLPSLQETWIKLTNNRWKDVKITSDNFPKYEKDWMEFEAEVYKMGQALSAEKFNALADSLVACFAGNKNLWAGESTELSTDTEIIEDIDLLHYLADILCADAKVVRAAIKDVVGAEDNKFAPLLPQELTIRSNLTWLANRDFYDKILNALAKTRPETEKYKPIYRAIHAFFGGAGVGKTTAITGLTAKILKKLGANVEMIYAAPSKEQAENLQKSCGSDGTVYTIDELTNTIFDEWPSNNAKDDGTIKTTGHAKYQGAAVFVSRRALKSGQYNRETLFSDDMYKKTTSGTIVSPFKTSSAKIKVLVVDEATQLTTAQWDCLSTRACHKKDAFSILAMGDLHQQCAKVDCYYQINDSGVITPTRPDERGMTSTLEEGLLLKSPRISVTMRANNMALYKAAQAYNRAFEVCEKKQVKDGKIGVFGKYNTNIEELKEATKSITHSYWHSNDYSQFCGVYACPSTTASTILSNIVKTTKASNICYIGDETNSVNPPSGVNVRNINNAQGGEFDYVVLDIKWLEGNSQDTKFGAEVNLFRSLYTMIQRAKKGCIIVNDAANGDVLSHFGITQSFDPGCVDGFELSEAQVKEYKNWRLKSYEDLKYDAEAFRKIFKTSNVTGGINPGTTKGTTAPTEERKDASYRKPDQPIGPNSVRPTDEGTTVGKKGFTESSKNDVDKALRDREEIMTGTKGKLKTAVEAARSEKNIETASHTNQWGNPGQFKEWWKNNKEEYINQGILDQDTAVDTLNYLSDLIKISYSTYYENKDSIGENALIRKFGLIIPKAYDENGVFRKNCHSSEGGKDEIIADAYLTGLTEEQIANLNQDLGNGAPRLGIPDIAGIAPELHIEAVEGVAGKTNSDGAITPARLVVAVFKDGDGNVRLRVPIDIMYTGKIGVYKGRIQRAAHVNFDMDAKDPKKDEEKFRGKASVKSVVESYGLYSFGTRVYVGGKNDKYGKFSQELTNQHAAFLGVTDNFAIATLASRMEDGTYWNTTPFNNGTYIHDFVGDSTIVGVELTAKPSDVVKYCCAINDLRDALRKCNSKINGEWVISDDDLTEEGSLAEKRKKAEELGKVIYGDKFTLPDLAHDRAVLVKQADSTDVSGCYNQEQYRCLTENPDPEYQEVNQAERFAGKFAAMTIMNKDWAKAFNFVMSSLWMDNIYSLSRRMQKTIKEGSIRLNFTLKDGKDYTNYTVIPDPTNKSNISVYKTTELDEFGTNAKALYIQPLSAASFENAHTPFTDMLRQLTKGKSDAEACKMIQGMNVSYELNGDSGRRIVMNDGHLIQQLFFWIENNDYDDGNGGTMHLYSGIKKEDIYDSLDANLFADSTYKLGVFVNNASNTQRGDLARLIYEDDSKLVMDRPVWKYARYKYNGSNWIESAEKLNKNDEEESKQAALEKQNEKLAKEWLAKFNGAVLAKFDGKRYTKYKEAIKKATEEDSDASLQRKFKDAYKTAENEEAKKDLKYRYISRLNDILREMTEKGSYYKIIVDSEGNPSIESTVILKEYLEAYIEKSTGEDQNFTISEIGEKTNSRAVEYQFFSVSLGNETKKYLVSTNDNESTPSLVQVDDEFIDSVNMVQAELDKLPASDMKTNVKTFIINSMVNANAFEQLTNNGMTAIMPLFSSTIVDNTSLRDAVLGYLEMRLAKEMC